MTRLLKTGGMTWLAALIAGTAMAGAAMADGTPASPKATADGTPATAGATTGDRAPAGPSGTDGGTPAGPSGTNGGTPASPSGALSFNSDFATGLSTWTTGGGGAQCANYGTPSTAPRLRGTFQVMSPGATPGSPMGVFTLPSDTSPSYPLEACELLEPLKPIGLGTDVYYGSMFYVPRGFNVGTNSFWGISTAQFHFQNIWGSPIQYELHNDHMTLAVQTGACQNHTTIRPGCTWHSNADNPGGNPGTLPAEYAVPIGMQQGVWHELVMHVHWASDNTGQIQVWHRVMYDPNWTQTVDLKGIPTVQWDATHGCCSPKAMDKIGAYRSASRVPVTLAEANITNGPSFNLVAADLP